MDQRVGLTFTDEDLQLMERVRGHLEKTMGKVTQLIVVRYCLRRTAAEIEITVPKKKGR
jgi:hypothetical protein